MRFHAGFYKARPDVNSVIHTHSHYVSVFATTRRTIGTYNVVSVLFYEDQALYEDDGTHPPVDPDLMCRGARRPARAPDQEPRRDHRLAVARERDHRGVHARSRGRVPHRSGGDRRHRVPRGRGTARPRGQYHKYFLPQMWDANFRRLRKTDPDLFECHRLMTDATACGGLDRRRLQPGDGGPDGHDDPRRPRRRRREDRAAARRLRPRRAGIPHVEPRQALGGARPHARGRPRAGPRARRETPTSSSRASGPASPSASGSGTTPSPRPTPGSSTARSPGFGRDDPRSQRRTYEVDVAATAGRMVGPRPPERCDPEPGPRRAALHRGADRVVRRRAARAARDPRRAARARSAPGRASGSTPAWCAGEAAFLMRQDMGRGGPDREGLPETPTSRCTAAS